MYVNQQRVQQLAIELETHVVLANLNARRAKPDTAINSSINKQQTMQ
jgi:hypothetical protein